MSEEQLGSLAATVEDAVPDPAVAVPDQAVGANAGLDPAVGENAVPDPEVGEIRIARPDSGPDLYVLIIEVRPAYVQALLCDEQYQLATDTDAVLEPSTTGFLRRLLVHGDVSASILTRRLSGPIARIEPRLVERITLRGQGLDFNSADLGRGRTLSGDSDPRWGWKLDRHRQVRSIRGPRQRARALDLQARPPRGVTPPEGLRCRSGRGAREAYRHGRSSGRYSPRCRARRASAWTRAITSTRSSRAVRLFS
jgi:hypothetical protein